MYTNSSWGPTDDGRIKPDVVTCTGSNSTPGSANDSAYQGLGGTSFACGAASGSLLLLQQHHFNLRNRYMKSSTLKGLVIHTANRCKTTFGPNYESGWGLINIAKSVQVLSDSNSNIVKEYTLNNNDTFNLMVYVNGVDTAKATICWTDPPAVVSAPAYNDTTPKLVNDIDMRLFSLANGQEYKPFILNPSNPSAAAINGDNFRDNVEQIYGLGLPQGFYNLRISHKRNLQNNQSQDFSLVSSNFVITPSVISVANSAALKVIFTKAHSMQWFIGLMFLCLLLPLLLMICTLAVQGHIHLMISAILKFGTTIAQILIQALLNYYLPLPIIWE
jgi:hypothetical protein